MKCTLVPGLIEAALERGVRDEIAAWQSRPLEALYPVIYLDALIIKIRDGAHVGIRPVHIAAGIDMDGINHVLGMRIQRTEGVKFWAGICANLANRGVRDVLIVCCDELATFSSALGQKYPIAAPEPADASPKAGSSKDRPSRTGNKPSDNSPSPTPTESTPSYDPPSHICTCNLTGFRHGFQPSGNYNQARRKHRQPDVSRHSVERNVLR
jgi:hypothetical protein